MNQRNEAEEHFRFSKNIVKGQKVNHKSIKGEKIMLRKLTYLVLLTFFLSVGTIGFCDVAMPLPTDSAVTDTGAPILNYESLHGAVDWYRESAEKNTMYSEIFQMAYPVIQFNVSQLKDAGKKKWGVIFDIDETILNNADLDYAFYQAKTTFDQSIQDKFIQEGKGTANPGVVELIKNIKASGGYVSIVSNRNSNWTYDIMECTKAQLHNIGLDYQTDYDQILLWTPGRDTPGPDGKSADKNSRFQAIINGTAPSTLPVQTVVAWFGDNILDFPEQSQSNYDIKKFGKEGGKGKEGEEDVNASSCYSTYFCLPNPMYGSFTSVPEPPLSVVQ